MSDDRGAPRRNVGRKPAKDRPSGGPPLDGTVDALLDMADDLEEQGRELLRSARQLQRLAERMNQSRGEARDDRARGPARSASATSRPDRTGGGARPASRGPGPRVERGATRPGGKPTREGDRPITRNRTETEDEFRSPADDWSTTPDRRPRRPKGAGGGERPERPSGSDRGSAPRRESGGGRKGGKTGGGKSGGGKPGWAPKGKKR